MLLWIDTETTGLDPERDIPLEVGLILMEEGANLHREIGRRSWICAVKDFDFYPSDQFVHEMHTKNGLLNDLKIAKKVYQSYNEIDDEMCDWLFTFVDPTTTLHPAGSSVHFDVDFIRRRFPRLAHHLHHRYLDVSSVKMLYPQIGREYDKGPEDIHRTLSDLDHDIAWLQWFLSKAAAFFPMTEVRNGALPSDSE